MWRILIFCASSLGLFGWTDSDAAIQARLKAKLAHSKLSGDGLRFEVRQGTVEWDGVVPVAQHKGAATRMAKMAGAARVVNRIRVTGGKARRAETNVARPAPREVTVQVPKR